MSTKFKYIFMLVSIFFTSMILNGISRLSADIDEERSFFKLFNIMSDGSILPLWDTDPLSTGWILQINEKYVTPAESGWFREISREGNRFTLTFSSPQFEIHNALFITENEKNAIINVEITNKTNQAVNIGPKLLIDTAKTDSAGSAFFTDSNRQFSSEHVFTYSTMPAWIRSVSEKNKASFTLNLQQSVATRPRAIILSNWQRIKQSNGDFGIRPGRKFDLLPFSIDDSAMLINFSSKTIEPGSKYKIVLVFGLDGSVLAEKLLLTEKKETVTNGIPPNLPAIPHINILEIDPVTTIPPDLSILNNNEDIQLRLSTINQRLSDIEGIEQTIDNLLQSDSLMDEQLILEAEILVDNQQQLQLEYESFK